jgi:hypothetical protein
MVWLVGWLVGSLVGLKIPTAFQSRQKIFRCGVKIARKPSLAQGKIASAFPFFAL